MLLNEPVLTVIKKQKPALVSMYSNIPPNRREAENYQRPCRQPYGNKRICMSWEFKRRSCWEGAAFGEAWGIIAGLGFWGGWSVGWKNTFICLSKTKIVFQLWYKKKRKKKKICPWRISLSAVYSFKTKFTEWRPNDGTMLSLSSNLDNNFPVNSSIKCLPISAAKDIQLIWSKQLPVISSEVRKKYYPG